MCSLNVRNHVVCFCFFSHETQMFHCSCSNHCPQHLYSFLFKFSNDDNVICHDKHIIHSSIMHLTSLFSLLSRDSGKNAPSLTFTFSHPSCHALWKTQERLDARQMHFTLVECICSRRTTMALRILGGHAGVVSVLEMESAPRPHPWRPHLQSPRSKIQNNQPGQSPDTFPSNFHCRMCSFSG